MKWPTAKIRGFIPTKDILLVGLSCWGLVHSYDDENRREKANQLKIRIVGFFLIPFLFMSSSFLTDYRLYFVTLVSLNLRIMKGHRFDFSPSNLFPFPSHITTASSYFLPFITCCFVTNKLIGGFESSG